MQIVLFDNQQRKKLYPFTTTQAVASIRAGMFTSKERWEFLTGLNIEVLTEDYIQACYNPFPDGDVLLIDASVVATPKLVKRVLELNVGEYLSYSKGFIAGRFVSEAPITLSVLFDTAFNRVHHWHDEVLRIDFPWQIFQQNEVLIKQDFEVYTQNKTSSNLQESNAVFYPSNVFIEEGASVECSILNASAGSIYIGKNATVMEGCVLRGPLVVGENSVLKMGSKVYGATTIGPNCVIGGEIKNSVVFANSNKAHDGYLGDSVIGEWCNLGAGTSNSNLKNNASQVKVFNAATNSNVEVGQKCGVIMGHYTKVAINSSINTGSVYGIGCNIFGEGLLPKNIQPFSWGTTGKYVLDKCIADIENWKQLKNQSLSKQEKDVIEAFFNG